MVAQKRYVLRGKEPREEGENAKKKTIVVLDAKRRCRERAAGGTQEHGTRF